MSIAITQGCIGLALGCLLVPVGHAQTVTVHSDATEQAAATESDMLLLEVMVDMQPLTDTLAAYQTEQDVLLPLGELARLLTLAITTQPEQGTASGFILDEERTFSLDLARVTVSLNGKSEAIDPRQVEGRSDDIYVSSRLLARWLPVDLEVDMSRLTLVVRARERLPLQYRLERQDQATQVGARTATIGPQYPFHDTPYRAFSAPFIDQTLSLDYRGGNGRSDTDARYSAYATGDLLGTQAALQISAGTQAESDIRLTLGRHDPDAGLLGPLRARTALIGSISAPAVANISRTSPSGEGVVVSNRPLSQPTSFGQHTLEGPLPPGWDVELYINDVLIGFQTSEPEGRYRFIDQQLVFGPNEFRLVFHGPLGEVRVERETFLLESSITPAGKFYYSVVLQRDKDGKTRTVTQFDRGISENLTATGGIVRASVAGKEETYTHLGMQAYWRAMILSGDMVKSQDGGSLIELALRTRLGKWAISASHARLENFTSELFLPSSDPVQSSDRLRMDGALSLPATSMRLPVTLEATRQQRESGASTLDVAGRMSAHVRGTSITGQARWQTSAEHEIGDTTLQVSRRVGGVSVRGQVTYAFAPEPEWTSIAVSADKRWGQGYLQSVGIIRLFGTSETQYTTGLTKSLGDFGLGINLGYSTAGDITAGMQVFMGMGREPRASDWMFDAQPMANDGAASVRVFLDDNRNGQWDAGEQPIEGVGFTVNGGKQPTTTGADGIAYLPRLPVMQHTDIAVIPETLEDPQWLPQVRGMRVLPRPGAVAMLDFPVLVTNEIDGTVYVVENGQPREMGGLEIEVMDEAGTVVATSKSASDGYYVLIAVPVGEYRVRVAPEQLARLRLWDPSTHPVSVTGEGWLVSGIDIELYPLADNDAGSGQRP